MTTYKVGPKGQVVVPKAIRDQLGLEPGHEVEVELDGEEIRVRRAARRAPGDFRGVWKSSGALSRWEEEKRREIELEDQRDRA